MNSIRQCAVLLAAIFAYAAGTAAMAETLGGYYRGDSGREILLRKVAHETGRAVYYALILENKDNGGALYIVEGNDRTTRWTPIYLRSKDSILARDLAYRPAFVGTQNGDQLTLAPQDLGQKMRCGDPLPEDSDARAKCARALRFQRTSGKLWGELPKNSRSFRADDSVLTFPPPSSWEVGGHLTFGDSTQSGPFVVEEAMSGIGIIYRAGNTSGSPTTLAALVPVGADSLLVIRLFEKKISMTHPIQALKAE